MNGTLRTPGSTSRDKTTKTTGKGEAVDEPSDGTNAKPAETIEGTLQQLRDELNTARQTRGNADGSFVDLEARLNILEGVERDYPTTKKTYDAAYPQLLREKDNITDYLDSEESKLKTRLGDKTAEDVEGLVNALQEETEALEKAVHDALNPQSGAPQEFLQLAIKDRTAELNTWKNLTATVTAQHAELKKFREDITKARQEGHYGLAYGMVQLAKKKQDAHQEGPGLVPPAELHQGFHKAGMDLAIAQENLATAQRQIETHKTVLAAAVKALEEHQKTAEAKLRVDLVDVAPQDDGTPATNGEGPATTTAGQAAGGNTPAGSARTSSRSGGAPSTADAVNGAPTTGGVAIADPENQDTAATEKTGDS